MCRRNTDNSDGRTKKRTKGLFAAVLSLLVAMFSLLRMTHVHQNLTWSDPNIDLPWDDLAARLLYANITKDHHFYDIRKSRHIPSWQDTLELLADPNARLNYADLMDYNNSTDLILRHLQQARNRSSNLDTLPEMRFRGASGLGHRLIRMAAAYYIAQMVGIRRMHMESQSTYCKSETLLTAYLFGADPLVVYPPSVRQRDMNTQDLFPFEIPKYYRSKLLSPTFATTEVKGDIIKGPHQIEFRNEVPGFAHKHSEPAKRWFKKNSFFNKPQTDYELFSQLQLNYRHQQKVEDFIHAHQWDRHVVFGLHVRAGNGEKGDFDNKDRPIDDLDGWINNTMEVMHQYRQQLPTYFVDRPLMLFLATDTGIVVEKFQMLTQQRRYRHIRVISYPQPYLDSGKSVTAFAKDRSQEQCLSDWENMLLDMILLGRADVVVAGRYSSFTQSMPLSSVMHRAELHYHSGGGKGHPPMFCEMGWTGENMQCFSSYDGWFLNKPSLIIGDAGKDFHFRYNAIKMPSRLTWEILETVFQNTSVLFDRFGKQN